MKASTDWESPEAANGPIRVIENGDRVRVDLPGRRVDLVGCAGKTLEVGEAEELLVSRMRARPVVRPVSASLARGVLGLYQTLASSAMEGALMAVRTDSV